LTGLREANAYAYKKMYSEAAAEWETAIKLSGNSRLATELGEAYKSSGYKGFLQRWLEDSLQKRSEERQPYEIAWQYAALGNKDEAINWLEKAYAAHAAGMIFMKTEPFFDSLHSDPRFQSLERRVTFPL
jgi:tetratricopeptide (TPR) repeat protein